MRSQKSWCCCQMRDGRYQQIWNVCIFLFLDLDFCVCVALECGNFLDIDFFLKLGLGRLVVGTFLPGEGEILEVDKLESSEEG